MVRPKKNRIVKFNPDVVYFKPRGIPIFDLEEGSLTIKEFMLSVICLGLKK